MSVRLDIWLNIACLFKTRSQAQSACRKGRIQVNGLKAKANRIVQPGDEISFSQRGWRRRFKVIDTADKSVSREHARLLYDDLSPPRPQLDPLQRILSQPVERERGKGRPTKRERRDINRLRGD